MQNDQSQPPISSHDDSRVLRYLLHNVKGISAVSGGVMGDALEQEYQAAEEDFRIDSGIEFDY